MPTLRYTGNARVFKTAKHEAAPDHIPRLIVVERENSRIVDVDEKTADKLLDIGVFEVVNDRDDDAVCSAIMSDGEMCGRDLPCGYHDEE